VRVGLSRTLDITHGSESDRLMERGLLAIRWGIFGFHEFVTVEAAFA